jgi:hypothetical protein
MDDRPYRLLLHGIDSLQCTYSLYPADHRTMDFENLRILKEDLREAKVEELRLIRLPQFVGDATLIRQPERKGEP